MRQTAISRLKVRVPFVFIAVAVLFGDSRAIGAARKELGVASLIYVGTRTNEKSKGIYLFRMRTSDNPDIPEFVTTTPLGLAAETPSPSYFEIDGKRRVLFCVNEVDEFQGKKSGSVSAFSIQPDSGKLTLLNQRASAGSGPCHLALDREGRHLLVANYNGGSVSVLPVGVDGALGEAIDTELHTGKSVHALRQAAPHPSGVVFSPDNKFAYVCDLGLDRVMCYRFDSATGKLSANDPPSAVVKPGAGPRRMIFRPDGKFAYVLNELDSTITAFSYEPGTGALKELQTIGTLPGYYDGSNFTAQIDVHPDGKYLFASNCGHNSIVLFSIDAASGELTYIEDQSTYGTVPRHFGIDDAGKHLAVANEESGSILILRAPESGRVKPGGNVVETPSPTCAKFLPP